MPEIVVATDRFAAEQIVEQLVLRLTEDQILL